MCTAAIAVLMFLAAGTGTATSASVRHADDIILPTPGSRWSRENRFPSLNSGSVGVQLPSEAIDDEVQLRVGEHLEVPCLGHGTRRPLRWWAPMAGPYSYASMAVQAANADGTDTDRPLRIASVNGNLSGLYCCSPDAVHDNDTVYHTDTRKCFYLFVIDPSTPIVNISKGYQDVSVIQGRSVTIPCRPSSREVKLQLFAMGSPTPDTSWTFDPRQGFTKIATMSGQSLRICKLETDPQKRQLFRLFVKENPLDLERPRLDVPLLLREGADLVYTCSVKAHINTDVKLRLFLEGLSPKSEEESPVGYSPVKEKDKRLTRKTAKAIWVTARSGDKGRACCEAADHNDNRNSTCKVVRVKRKGSPPELLLALDPQPPAVGEDSGAADTLVTMKRGPTFYWYVRVAWEEDSLPVAMWKDPDDVMRTVNIPKKGFDGAFENGVTVTWHIPLNKTNGTKQVVTRNNTLVVKVPTRSAEPGNYTLEVSVGKAKQSVQLEAVLQGRPLPHLLNDSLVVVAGAPLRAVCVARAHPPPFAISWFWMRCDGLQACDDKAAAGGAGEGAGAGGVAAGGGAGAGAEPVTEADARTEERWGGRDTLLSTLTVEEPAAGRWLRCEANNTEGSGRSKPRKLQVALAITRGPSAGLVGGVVGVVALIIGAAAACIYITLRQKRERRRLHCAGLQGLVAGEPGALDPTLPADEQAELLPYQTRWEFPREDLVLGRQLGAGAFGVVMKAEARGILEDEGVTTVAVKMLKRGAEDAYLRALASELKILVHLGRHLNVVNLLGACTEKIMERELLVIVEYCPFGNLHNYLLRHRDGFVDQIDPATGRVDGSRGAALLAAAEVAARRARLVLGVSSDSKPGSDDSGGMTTVTYCPMGENCTSGGSVYDSGGSSAPLSPLPTDDSSSSGGPQPLWRTLYRCDTRAPGRVLCTSDLLSWAFQVACGMKYLAQRKVLHGDLAARNVLLAKDGIVKICDFGLARSMYKSDTYKKKGDGPLPIKWMALESIRDRIFSTQSDVWSFGVVMWELFSLGATPYPGMQPSEEFYNKLLSGYRMECPQYAPLATYDLMGACWESDPCSRPTFEKLVSELGDLLDCSTRERFESLIAYEQQRGGVGGECDYLAMLGSPDYGALTAPAEHLYVNTPPTSPGCVMVPEPNVNPDPDPPNDYLNMSRPSTPGGKISFQ